MPLRTHAQFVGDVEPEIGTSGTTVRLYGSGLGSLTASSVTIGGEPVPSIISQASSVLEVEVPSGVSGPSEVAVSGLVGAERFTVVTGGTGDFPLREIVDDTNVDGPVSIEAGDIDGDGNQDLVVASLVSNDVRWYAGDGTGGFDGGTQVASGVNYPRDVELADLDQDSTLDIIVVEGAAEGGDSDGDDVIRSFLNTDGDGSSFSTQDVATGSNENLDDPRAIATGDFNADGAPDVVAVSQDNSAAYAYLNDDASSGSYTEVSVKGSGLGDPRAVHVADVDDNGAPDVLVGSESNDNVSWFPNDGAANFGGQSVINLNAARNPRGLDAADFDNDGLPEVLAALKGNDSNAGDGAVAWYDSTSGSWSRNTIATTDSVLAAVPADVNADGNVDVVAGSVGGDSLVWYENTGGSFASGVVLDTSDHAIRDIAISDFDDDGTLDPTSAAFAEDVVASYPNVASLTVDGSSPSQNAVGVDTTLAEITVTFTTTLDASTVGVDSVSVTGDQRGTVPEANGSVDVGGQTLTFEPGRTFLPGETITVSLDSLIASTGGVTLDSARTIQFTANSAPGSGAFADAGAGLTGVTGNSAVTSADWGDYNNDSALDLVVTGDAGGSEATTVYTNDGTGGLSALNNSSLTDVADGEAAWGDYNNDGLLDLVITGSASSGNVTEIYRNDGSGTFTAVATLTGLYNSDVDWGDYNGDGRPDLVLIGTDGSTPQAKIYRNDGDGSFSAIGAGLTGASEGEVAWGDYDNDNDLDLVVTGTDGSTSQTKIYRNDGSGSFVEATALSNDLTNVLNSSADWADIDDDGDLDLVVSGSTDGTASGRTTTVYRNDASGGGGFVSLGAGIANVSRGTVNWGDYDGNGSPDLAVTGLDDSTVPVETTQVYKNDGGSFASIEAGLTDTKDSAVDWGDTDGDGTLDLVATGSNGSGTPTATVYQQTAFPSPTAETPDTTHIHFAELKGTINLTGVTTRVYFNLISPSGASTLIPVDTFSVSGTETVRYPTPDTLQAQSTYDYSLVAATSVDSLASSFVSFTTEEPKLYVDAGATGEDDGLDWTSALPTLQGALDLARSGDSIWVASGTYYPDLGPGITDGVADTSFVLKEGVHIYGGFDGGEATLSGRRVDGTVDASKTVLSGDVDGDGTLSGNSYHVVVSPRGITRQTRLDGVTITGGNARGTGTENTTLVDVDGDGFAESDRGGGMYVNARKDTTSPTLANLAFTNNEASGDGGGLYLDAHQLGEASPEIANAVFAGNQANRGGGLAIYASAATESGGGISDPLIANALFRANQAINGADENGGAVFVRFESGSAVTPRFVHTTIAKNQASGDGGAIYAANLNYNEPSDSIRVHNSILSQNTASGSGDQIYGSSTSRSSGVGFVSSLIQGSGGSRAWNLAVGGDEGGNIGANPIFVDAAAGDLRLNWASPAIDEADATLVPGDSADLDTDGDVTEPLPVDQNGDLRDNGLRPDMGAYEGGAVPTTTTLYVDRSTGADSSTFGGDWGTPYRTLQAALAAAKNRQVFNNPFDRVQVARGVYYPDAGPGIVDGDTTASFQLVSGTNVLGGYPSGGGTRDAAANPTVLSGDIDQDDTVNSNGVTLTPADTTGNNSLHVVTMQQQDNAVLDGFIVTAGQADGAFGTPAAVGGGLLTEFSTPTIRNVRFQGNWAAEGGGALHIQDFSETLVEETLIRDNGTGGMGGGLRARNTAVVLDDVTVLNNQANFSGGGIALQTDSDAGADTVRSVTMSGNSAGATGGGLWAAGSQPVVVYNSVFSGNDATDGGGLRVATDAAITVTNSTFSNNTASNGGGAVLVDSTSNTEAFLQNAILWGNVGTSGSEVQVVSGATATVSAPSIVEGNAAGIGGAGTVNATSSDTLSADPMFVDANGPDDTPGTLDDDLRLNWASPAIDQGATTASLNGTGGDFVRSIGDVSTDRAGNPRLQGALVEIGAYEGGAAPSNTTVVFADSASGADADSSGGSWADPYRTVQAALQAARNAKRALGGVPFDEVWVAEGTYYPDDGPGRRPDARREAFGLVDSVAVYGGFQNGENVSQRDPNPTTNGTVLSGDITQSRDTTGNSRTVVSGGSGFGQVSLSRAAILDGFAIEGGNAVGANIPNGAGVQLLANGQELSPTLRNLRIENNVAEAGAGVAAIVAASDGGTLRPLLTDVVIARNEAVSSPGVGGGAVFGSGNGTVAPEFVNVRFRGNNAAQAAAFAVSSGNEGTATPALANVTVNGNVAATDSAAVLFQNTSSGTLEPQLVHTTWAQNTASSDSLDKLIEVRGTSSGTNVQIDNSVFGGNGARSTVGGLTGAVIVDSSVVEGAWSGSGAGVVNEDPRYANPDGPDGTPGTADDSLQVLGASAALNQGGASLRPPDVGDLDRDGDSTEALPQDLSGGPRVLTGQVDAGAYEGAASPSVVPTAVSNVADTSADLAGAVVPYAPSVDVTFEVEPTSGGTVQTISAGSSVSGTDSVAVNGTASGLQPNTAYAYRLVADDGSRSTISQADTFTTLASPPRGTADPATAVADSSVILQATVQPNGAETSVTFEYGRDTNYGQSVVGIESPLTGSTEQADSATVGGLLPGTEYHYRAIASSSAGADTSSDRSVVTDPVAPRVQADSASAIIETTATLYGGVNPGGDTTAVWLRVYPSGESAAADTTFASETPVAGTRDTAVSATVSGLASGTEYAFEVVAANGVDTSRSSVRTFATVNAPPVATSDTAQTDEDRAVDIPVLSDDRADGTIDSASVTVVDSPAIGTATVDSATGRIRYGPDVNVNGTDSLRYTVADEAGKTSNEATVRIEIAPVNDAPVAWADTSSVIEGGSVTVNVLENDTDIESRLDTTSLQVIAGPFSGDVTDVTDGRLTYGPNPGYSGPDSLRYVVADRVGEPQEQVKRDTATTRLQVIDVALSVQRGIQRAGVVQLGESGETVTVTVENDGETALTGLDAILQGAAADDFQIDGSIGDGALEVGATRSVEVTFQPSTVGRRQTDLVVTSAEGGRDTTVVRGRGVRVTTTADAPKRGETAEIAVSVEGGFKARVDRRLFARRGGASGYRGTELGVVDSTEQTLQLQGQLPDTLVTRRGIDYYAVLAGTADTVTVPAGGAAQAHQRPRHLPVQFDSLTAPVRVPARSYRMVTVPVRPSGGTKAALEATYGSYDPQVWRLLRWDADEKNYREHPEIDSLRPGEAFWLITSEGEAPVFEAGQTAEAGKARRVPLKAGWNQVGSPFGYAVPWDTVQAASGLGPAEVDGPVAYRDSAYRRTVNELGAWRGYFVFSAERDTLVVPPVGRTGPSQTSGPAALAKTDRVGRSANGVGAGRRSRSGRTPGQDEEKRGETPDRKGQGASLDGQPASLGENGQGTEPPERGGGTVGSTGGGTQKNDATKAAEEVPYTVKVEARTGDGRPSQVWMGLRAEAKAGRGPMDFAQAPPIGNGVRLSVSEQVAGRTVPHAGSFKPTGKEGRSWRLRLKNPSEAAQDVQIGLKSVGGLPSGQSRYVLDLGKGRRMAPGQTVTVGAGEQRALKVIVGTKAYAETESEGIGLDAFTNELRGNYPNPFGQETTVGYTLAKKQEVTVEVYNVLGQRVHTLVREKEQRAGLHRVQWAAENRYGEPVGSGVYFVRIRAEGFTQTKKMVLVR